MHSVGLEPTQPKLLELESSALDHSAMNAYTTSIFNPLHSFCKENPTVPRHQLSYVDVADATDRLSSSVVPRSRLTYMYIWVEEITATATTTRNRLEAFFQDQTGRNVDIVRGSVCGNGRSGRCL